MSVEMGRQILAKYFQFPLTVALLTRKEDFEFFPKKLAKLWILEGFMEEAEEKMAEDTARKYLEELTQSWMIEKANKRFDGLPKTYRINNIFRQMCIGEAQKYGFFKISDYGETPPLFSTSFRRLAVHKTSDWYDSDAISSLRSIFCFRGCTVHLSKLLDRSDYLLKVLHLEGSHIREKTLPENIGRALHLRYLNLRDTGIKSLPSSISDLKMLEILDLRGNHIGRIPTEIQKLTRLKELHMDSETTSMDGESSDVSSLSGLCTLSIRAGSWMDDGLSKLGRLKNFRLYGDLGLCPDALPKCLRHLKDLQFFRLGIGFGGTFPDLGSILPKTSLPLLELKRSLDKLPDPANFHSHLTYLCLKWSQLKDDPMPTLERLLHLQVLRLRCCSYLGEKMVCSRGGFRSLENLELAMLNKLEEWVVEELEERMEGEMPMRSLRHLVVSCCKRLKMLPQGLPHLEKLEVSGMPETFNDRLKRNEGEDWNKIQHIKSITVDEIQLNVPL